MNMRSEARNEESEDLKIILSITPDFYLSLKIECGIDIFL